MLSVVLYRAAVLALLGFIVLFHVAAGIPRFAPVVVLSPPPPLAAAQAALAYAAPAVHVGQAKIGARATAAAETIEIADIRRPDLESATTGDAARLAMLGIIDGDSLIAVNDVPVTSSSGLEGLSRALRGSPSPFFDIELRRNGRLRRILLVVHG